MRFNTAVHTADLASIFSRFIAIVGWGVWKKRLANLGDTRVRSPVLKEYIAERHALELELARVIHRRKGTGRSPRRVQTEELYRLASFSSAVTAIYPQLSDRGQRQFRGRLLDALNNNFRPLEHEVHVATHFMSRGFNVEFPDLEGTDRFDLLASKSSREIEVECKTVGYDLGRKIHRLDFVLLAERLYPTLRRFVDGRIQSKLVVLSVCERLSSTDSFLAKVEELVTNGLYQEQRLLVHTDLSLEFCDHAFQELPPDPSAIREQVEQKIGTDQFHVMICGNEKAVVLFVAYSKKRDQVLSYMMHQMRGASDQFTRGRVGILAVQVADIYPDEWASLASNSALQRMTHRYLQSRSRSNVHSVAYNSTGSLERRNSIVTQYETALCFHNPNHPLRDDKLLAVFE